MKVGYQDAGVLILHPGDIVMNTDEVMLGIVNDAGKIEGWPPRGIELTTLTLESTPRMPYREGAALGAYPTRSWDAPTQATPVESIELIKASVLEPYLRRFWNNPRGG